MKWLLFFSLTYGAGNGGGVTSGVVEFWREDDCWRAAKLWESTHSWNNRLSSTAYCVPKGEK